jgi:hypothetical protein
MQIKHKSSQLIPTMAINKKRVGNKDEGEDEKLEKGNS